MRLRLHAEAELHVTHLANIEVYMEKVVGIREHLDIVTEAVNKELDAIRVPQDRLEMLNTHFND